MYRRDIYSNLLKFITLDGRYGGIEARHALRRIIPCDFVYLCSIALFIVEMREVKPIRAISVEFQKPRRYDAVFQIYSLAANVPFSLQDKPRLVRYDQMIVDKFAIQDVATVGKESEPA